MPKTDKAPKGKGGRAEAPPNRPPSEPLPPPHVPSGGPESGTKNEGPGCGC